MLAPCPRLDCSVESTDDGRFATSLPNALAALLAAAQFLLPSAEETWSSWLLRVAD